MAEEAQDSDWLKYLCVALGLLIAVVAVLYVKISGDHADYVEANRVAARMLTTTNGAPGEPPRSIPGLALEVVKYAEAYQEAIGPGTAGAGRERSEAALNSILHAAHLPITVRGGWDDQPNRRRNFTEWQKKYTVGHTRAENLIRAMFEIERKTTYRVFDMHWKMLPQTDQTGDPKNEIGQVSFELGYRIPLTSE